MSVYLAAALRWVNREKRWRCKGCRLLMTYEQIKPSGWCPRCGGVVSRDI